IHGENVTGKTQDKITQIIGKYSLQGYNIKHVFFGHLHSSYDSDFFSRNSSLCGSNTYNENALQLLGKAAQNFHILSDDGEMDSIKVDLQFSKGDGYDIQDVLEAYHCKSADKLHKNETIMRIII
ncbi:MAG: hypothetical protein GW914_01655, partial [Candidatus Aenigmarchaeota archaeon]|nr:hypothetical protein [Candidatus Aenigmarchaeota archaeon]